MTGTAVTKRLSQNVEFHGHAISGTVGVARGAIPDDKTDANHHYNGHICIQGYYLEDRNKKNYTSTYFLLILFNSSTLVQNPVFPI